MFSVRPVSRQGAGRCAEHWEAWGSQHRLARGHSITHVLPCSASDAGAGASRHAGHLEAPGIDRADAAATRGRRAGMF